MEGLRTFGYTWEEFTALPSRKTCGEDVQAERKELLENVRELDDTTPVADFSAVSFCIEWTDRPQILLLDGVRLTRVRIASV